MCLICRCAFYPVSTIDLKGNNILCMIHVDIKIIPKLKALLDAKFVVKTALLSYC